MYEKLFVYIFVIFCSSAISKPMEGDGQGDNLVVNMDANGQQGNANPGNESVSGNVDHKVTGNPSENQLNNPPTNQESNPPANQGNPLANQESNPPANHGSNTPANHDSNPPANQEINSPANQETNPPANQESNPPANNGTTHQNEGQKSDAHSLVTGAAAASENPHKAVEQNQDEVDWGHAEKNDVVVNVDLSHLRQEQQQQTEEQQQQTDEEQPLAQQKVKEDKTETGQEASESPQLSGTGEHTNARQDIGVVEPEDVMHGDEAHGDHHGGPDNATRIKEKEAEMKHHAQERIESEKREMEDVQPKVIGSNVHDSTARKLADFMKDRQFGPDDVEEAVHGGQHVHGENAEGRPNQVQAGDVESIAHGEEGVHEHHKADDKGPMSVDPDEMMHAGDGGDHPHDRPETEPRLETLPDTHIPGNGNVVVKKNHTEHGVVGPDVEPVVHDGEHVHDKPSSQKSKHKVRYQDIIDLGLSQEQLKGIDLSKLLEQEKNEMEAWHSDRNEKEGINEQDMDDKERNAFFWQKVTELRKTYLEKLYAKVRHLSNPDLDNAEWESDGLKDVSPHEGESAVEHEMEMWANTASKGNRKQYKTMMESWQKKEEVQKENVTHEHQAALEEVTADEERHTGENVEKAPVEVKEVNLNGDENEQREHDLGEDTEENDEEGSNDL